MAKLFIRDGIGHDKQIVAHVGSRAVVVHERTEQEIANDYIRTWGNGDVARLIVTGEIGDAKAVMAVAQKRGLIKSLWHHVKDAKKAGLLQ